METATLNEDARYIGAMPYVNAYAITTTLEMMDEIIESSHYKNMLKKTVNKVVDECNAYQCRIKTKMGGYWKEFAQEYNEIVMDANKAVPQLSKAIDNQFKQLGCVDDEKRKYLTDAETARSAVVVANCIWDDNAKQQAEASGGAMIVIKNHPLRLSSLIAEMDKMMTELHKRIGNPKWMNVEADECVQSAMVELYDKIAMSQHCKTVVTNN